MCLFRGKPYEAHLLGLQGNSYRKTFKSSLKIMLLPLLLSSLLPLLDFADHQKHVLFFSLKFALSSKLFSHFLTMYFFFP